MVFRLRNRAFLVVKDTIQLYRFLLEPLYLILQVSNPVVIHKARVDFVLLVLQVLELLAHLGHVSHIRIDKICRMRPQLLRKAALQAVYLVVDL